MLTRPFRRHIAEPDCDDADNVRFDTANGQILVSYGAGAIGVIDPQSHGKIKTFPLKAHPESFRIDSASKRLFVKLPNARSIVVLRTETGVPLVTWTIRYGANFVMALDHERKRVLVAFRSTPKIVAFDMQSGATIGESDICGDSDDLFLDRKRERIYVSCGTGYFDALNADNPKYTRLARMPSASGARTALIVPEIDRLFVAVGARFGEPAAIWVYRPTP